MNMTIMKITCPKCKDSESVPKNKFFGPLIYTKFEAQMKSTFGFQKLHLKCKNCSNELLIELSEEYNGEIVQEIQIADEEEIRSITQATAAVEAKNGSREILNKSTFLQGAVITIIGIIIFKIFVYTIGLGKVESILASPKYRIFDHSLYYLKSSDVPDYIITKLERIKEGSIPSFFKTVFGHTVTEEEFLQRVVATIGHDDTEKYKTQILKYASLPHPFLGYEYIRKEIRRRHEAEERRKYDEINKAIWLNEFNKAAPRK